jgi:hypothetical protein
MFKYLLISFGGAVMALGLMAGAIFLANTSHAGVDPWSDDSLCDVQDRYNGIAYYQWQGDLCSNFEVEQAQLLNDVVEFAYDKALGEEAYASPYPCAQVTGNAPDGSDSNFYMNRGGLDVGSAGARNVWFNSDGIICEVGSIQHVMANPQVRIPELTGRTLKSFWDEYMQFVPERTQAQPLTNDQLTQCVPAGNCSDFIVYKSMKEFDQNFVNKRYPLTADQVKTTLICTVDGVRQPC